MSVSGTLTLHHILIIYCFMPPSQGLQCYKSGKRTCGAQTGPPIHPCSHSIKHAATVYTNTQSCTPGFQTVGWRKFSAILYSLKMVSPIDPGNISFFSKGMQILLKQQGCELYMSRHSEFQKIFTGDPNLGRCTIVPHVVFRIFAYPFETSWPGSVGDPILNAKT